jgi:hypothetical protein
LRVCQANWKTEYKNYQDCQEEWKIASPAAFNLRDELVHYFYHAFYNNQGEYAKVQRIDEGNTNADMIQELIELSTLGMKHTAELEAIGLDLSLLDTARAKSFELELTPLTPIIPNAPLVTQVSGLWSSVSGLLFANFTLPYQSPQSP